MAKIQAAPQDKLDADPEPADQPGVRDRWQACRASGLGGRARRAAGQEQPVPDRSEDDRPLVQMTSDVNSQYPDSRARRRSSSTARCWRRPATGRRSSRSWSSAEIMRWSAALALLSMLALAVPASAKAPAEAPAKPAARADWTRTVSVTPEGGFRMGNPNAKVEARRIWLADLPALPPFRGDGGTSRFGRSNMCGPDRSATSSGNVHPRRALTVAVNLLARCSWPRQLLPDGSGPVCDPAACGGSRISDADMERFGALPQGQMMVADCRASAGLILTGRSASESLRPRLAQCLSRSEAAAKRLAHNDGRQPAPAA